MHLQTTMKKGLCPFVSYANTRALSLFSVRQPAVSLFLSFPHKISFSATEAHNDLSSMRSRLQSEMSVLEREHQTCFLAYITCSSQKH